MEVKRVRKRHLSVMDLLLSRIKFLAFIFLFFGLPSYEIFPRTCIVAEASLLEPRKIDTQVEADLVVVDDGLDSENLQEKDISYSFSENQSSSSPGVFYEGNNSNVSEEVFFLPHNRTDHFGWWTGLGWADAALVTLFSSVIAGTVVGNMLVIAAVVTTRRLRTVTNCFVMSLAVADWLVGMFVMPPKVFLYLVDNEWRFGRIICELWISLDILLCTASILSLCAISIDRYLAITRPLAYSRRRRSKRLALSMISCVWIAAVVITSPPIFGWYEENRNTENKCEYNENTGYVVYSALGSFFLPLLVMLYVYARIACVITRRQRSIQKLHARGDHRKSQYGGSDVEEPLHQKVREEVGAGEKHKNVLQRSASLLVERGHERDLQDICHHRELDERDSEDSIGTTTGGKNQESSFLGRFGLSSCTGGNSEDDEDGKSSKKNCGQHGNRQGKYPGCISGKKGDMDVAATDAIALPDPATLASSGTENSSGSTTDHENSCEHPQQLQHSHHLNQQLHQQTKQLHNRSIKNSGRCGGQNHRQQLQNNQYSSRMKTGSRLCHHSIATASPQKSIHRVHQSTGAAGREFGGAENDRNLKGDSSCQSLSQGARVWTVETSPATQTSLGKRKGGNAANANCTSCSYEHELAECSNPLGQVGIVGAVDKSASQIESVMIMDSSPAGNPASLMSAASSATGGNNMNVPNTSPLPPASSSGSSRDKRSPYSNRTHPNRIYQPNNNTQNSHHHSRTIPNHLSQPSMGGLQRLRSMKFVSQMQSNDQNHNGGTSSREFSSGRIASFKRETKTAQTLAAVVGGFIICWLPFFVAYVMGPFTPSSDTIPSGLMDALIWLGWSNSAINPFIYAFYSPEFRSAFWRLTVHKCEGVLRNRNQSRSSPRRYEDPPPQQRVSG